MRCVIAFFERFLVGVRRCEIGTVPVHAATIYSAVNERDWRSIPIATGIHKGSDRKHCPTGLSARRLGRSRDRRRLMGLNCEAAVGLRRPGANRTRSAWGVRRERIQGRRECTRGRN